MRDEIGPWKGPSFAGIRVLTIWIIANRRIVNLVTEYLLQYMGLTEEVSVSLQVRHRDQIPLATL